MIRRCTIFGDSRAAIDQPGVNKVPSTAGARPAKLCDVALRTRPLTRNGCLRHVSMAIGPPIENPARMALSTSRASRTATTSSAHWSSRNQGVFSPRPCPRWSTVITRVCSDRGPTTWSQLSGPDTPTP